MNKHTPLPTLLATLTVALTAGLVLGFAVPTGVADAAGMTKSTVRKIAVKG